MKLDKLQERHVVEVATMQLLADGPLVMGHHLLRLGNKSPTWAKPEFFNDNAAISSAEEEWLMCFAHSSTMIRIGFGKCWYCNRGDLTVYLYIVSEKRFWPKHYVLELVCNECYHTDSDGTCFREWEDVVLQLDAWKEGHTDGVL